MKHKEHLFYEDTISSRRMQGKRTLAVRETCKIELKSELQRLFMVFGKAVIKAEVLINQISPQARGRGFEPAVMQSCFMDELQAEFGNEASFGKYKRIILRKKGYIILFKKLNKHGFPMNTKTANIQSILNQNQVLDLFAQTDYNDEPILYFGYQSNKHGAVENPQLVYIDDGEISFNITQEEVGYMLPITAKTTTDSVVKMPKLKGGLMKKKA